MHAASILRFGVHRVSRLFRVTATGSRAYGVLRPVAPPRPHSRSERFRFGGCRLLGGSWVVSGVIINRVTRIITHIRGFITPTYNYP